MSPDMVEEGIESVGVRKAGFEEGACVVEKLVRLVVQVAELTVLYSTSKNLVRSQL